jgi:NADH-quinone oxidoreductase subunit E
MAAAAPAKGTCAESGAKKPRRHWKTRTVPRDRQAAKPDDLKMISGVGPKIEGILHSLGIYTFDQVAEVEKGRARMG